MTNVNLTFDDLSSGTVVDNEYQAEGVTIFSIVDGQTNPSNKPAMVFDTNNPTGGDSDLATNNLDNVLIISEDGDSNDPDDNAAGGVLCFDFDDTVTMNSLTLLDVEEGARIKLWDVDGNLIYSCKYYTSDNGQKVVDLNGIDGVARMDIVMYGSGAVDNINYDTAVDLDGTVEGTSGDDVIDVAYAGDPDGDRVDNNDAILAGDTGDDDLIFGYAGDDEIVAGDGDDEVYGGSGDDSIEGNAGDDVIYGDTGDGTGSSGETVRESFEWDLQSEGQLDSSFVQDTGEVSVTFTRTADEGNHFSESVDETLNVSGIDSGAETIDADSGLHSETKGQAGRGEFKFEFSDEVSDVQFNVNDIDGDGVVKITAYDAAGNPIEVDLDGGNHLTLIDTDTVAGADTADSNGGYAPTTSDSYNLQVTIPGPVAKIVIEHTQDGQDNSGINITDMYYDVTVGGDAGADGNDVIDGGEGDDHLLGEGGDDVLTGGSGEDSIEGGDGSDIIHGGAGDTVDGGATGSDHDVLNLTGEGPFYLTDIVSDTTTGGNGNGFNGTVVFVDGNGDPTGETLTFTDIEEIIGDEINRGPDAQDDTATVEEDGVVTIDVLGNDSDPDGDTLEIISATVPADQGSVEIVNGELVFTPAENFNGEATISYTVSDGNGGEDSATVTVDVTPVNDDPVANDDSDTTDYGTPVTVDLLDNDTDVDGDTLTVTEATVPADQGTLVDNGDGTVTFTPAAGFTGDATISYTVSDGEGGSDSAVHTITVGDAPLDGTVNGTAGDDVIDGDYLGDPDGDQVDNDDAIIGGHAPNDDLIEAYGGNDTVDAGEGDDTVYGGTGNDMIDGDVGNDTLFGEDGDDKIEGSGGDDELYGGEGDDDLWGGANNDIVEGGAGNDTIAGGGGDDTLDGGEGDDSIDGGNNNDTINAGAGNDDVLGGSGDDVINTGDPDSATALPDVGYPGLYPADTDPNNDLDTVDAGSGDDIVSTGDDDDTIYGGTGNDSIDAGWDDDYVEAGRGHDTVIGSEGNDEIYGNDGNDVIYGGLGEGAPDAINIPDDGSGPFGADLVTDNNNDTLFGGAGNDTIYGADDADTLYGGADNDVLDGGVDDDIIFGDEGRDTIIGGQGEDEMYGGLGNDTFLGGNGGDVVVGGEDPDLNGDGQSDDNDVLDLTGSNVDFITYANGDPEAGTVTFLDGSTMTFSEIENVIPCFTPGTTIATPKGERLVEELREGDRIITRDNGIQEIRWVGRKEMTGKALVANPHLKPILVRAGSLGNGLPERDMLVSPNHRMLVANDKTQLYFEEREVLAAAKHLVGSEGIHAVDVMGTAYIHFMFDRHEVVLSNGAWTESFQPGDYSLKGIGNSQRNEIFELFPELQSKVGLEGYQSARRALKKHEAKLLVK